MIEQIIEYDKFLFSLINGQWHSNFLDSILPFIRNKYFWIPLYLFIVSFMILNFKKKSIWMIIGLILTIIIADQISSSLIKPYFERLRPCNDSSLADTVRLLVNCGGGKSFTSSHATNHFAIATLLSFILRPHFKFVSLVLVFWAGLISYAQIYVGVHFPFDVFCGALLGMTIGFIIYKLLENRINTLR